MPLSTAGCDPQSLRKIQAEHRASRSSPPFENIPSEVQKSLDLFSPDKSEQARRFVEKHGCFALPKLPRTEFLSPWNGVAACATSVDQTPHSDPGSLSYCVEHNCVTIDLKVILEMSIFHSQAYAEAAIVHEWTHAAQNQNYPAFFTAFGSLRDQNLLRSKIVKNMLRAPGGVRQEHRPLFFAVLAAMKQTTIEGECFHIVKEGHAKYVENLFFAERHKNESPQRHSLIFRSIALLWRLTDNLQYYLNPRNKPYRAGYALFRSLDELTNKQSITGSDDPQGIKEKAFGALFTKPQLAKKLLPKYNTRFSIYSASSVDRKQAQEFIQSLR